MASPAARRSPPKARVGSDPKTRSNSDLYTVFMEQVAFPYRSLMSPRCSLDRVEAGSGSKYHMSVMAGAYLPSWRTRVSGLGPRGRSAAVGSAHQFVAAAGASLPFMWSAAAVALATLAGIVLTSFARLPNVSMVFLLAVLFAAARFGLWPALLASGLSFLAYHFFFID